MGDLKCGLLDTDFVSKLHVTCKDDENRLIDRVLELPGYTFACHEQITIELDRHNAPAKDWLKAHIATGDIQKFSDKELIDELKKLYGKNATQMYLYYLSNACAVFSSGFYQESYEKLEQKIDVSDDDFIQEVVDCDMAIGCDNNLGEIKTYLLQQVLQNREGIRLFVFYSDDRRARGGLTSAAGIPGISALAVFYVIKERLGMEKAEAKLYFDSWMAFHKSNNQNSFKVHNSTKERQLIKMDGYEIFDRIYDGSVGLAKDGDLLLR